MTDCNVTDCNVSDCNVSDCNVSALTAEEAHKILKQFEGLEQRQPVESDRADEEAQLLKERLRQALAIVASQSDYQILGVCSDTLAEGYQALRSYAEALGYLSNLDWPNLDLPNLEAQTIKGSAYIKFNPQLGSCYADPYSGHHRGVLVSCQSAAAPGLNEMYGHLPLDLFEAEER
jgi:hypothetical protein